MSKKYKRCNLCEKLFLPNPDLKKVHKICRDCKTIRLSRNIEVSKIYKNLKKNPPTPADDELFFEDDPRALRNKDYTRYTNRTSTFIPKKDL